MARNWQSLVNELTPVQKLVHLAMRLTDPDADELRGVLLKQRRRVYEQELTHQAAKAGCPGRQGRLTSGPSLAELNRQSEADAKSITNTYNWDLVFAIKHIFEAAPRANRHVYAYRLRQWEESRQGWKNLQIARYTEGTARQLAQQDFNQFNAPTGVATLEPGTAVCPVCKGWIARGEVALHVAMRYPPPYHVNCPHWWDIDYDKYPKDECPNLWMGE